MITTLSAVATDVATQAEHFAPWGGGWWFIFIPLFWFLVIGLIFALVFRGRRRAWREAGWGPGYGGGPGYWGRFQGAATAEATLADRYARGDIDEKEYRARLEVLRANNTFTPPAS